MPIRLPALALGLALACVLLLATPAGARAESYVDVTVASWRADPVFTHDEAGALADDDADALRERIDGWRDDVYVAVLPAAALQEAPGADQPAQARAFLAQLADRLDRDGVYVVAFGGVGVYGAAVGTDDRVGPIVAEQVSEHTIGQLDQTLNGILDELGAPGGESSGSGGRGPLVATAVGVALVAAVGGGVLLSRRRPRSNRQPNSRGEIYAGPADFEPSFDVQPDEQDTVAERAGLAREDVTRLGEELDRDDLPTTDSAVAAHVQAALDAYYDASRRVDALTTDAELRQLGEITEYARWQQACAKARLGGDPLPARRSPCFLDPAHGVSVADWKWAPPGGVERPVPVCRACLVRVSGGQS